MGFTHAYFPMKVFDESVIRSGWAFGRVGKGYIALTASPGIELISLGPTAYRELRSRAREAVWLCHMGQQLLDGSFENFQQKILSLEPAFNGLSLDLHSLRKDHIEFSWTGPLKINGQEQPLANFPHFQNPYCAVSCPPLRWRSCTIKMASV
jgi:hypothetical protein